MTNNIEMYRATLELLHPAGPAGSYLYLVYRGKFLALYLFAFFLAEDHPPFCLFFLLSFLINSLLMLEQ